MLREVKFYARDILRGPYAKTPVAGVVSGALTGLIIGGFFLAVLYLLNV